MSGYYRQRYSNTPDNMISRQRDRYYLIPTLLVLLSFNPTFCPGETNREVKEACKLQNSQLVRTRDGPVDRKVFYQVAGIPAGAVVTVECDHRAVGAADWLIRIGGAETNKIDIDRRLIAGAILHAVDNLRSDYPSETIGQVYLEPVRMPTEFSTALFKAVAAQMRQLHSKAIRFNDPRARSMVREAYRRMEFVRYVRDCLQQEGFTVTIDTAELCCLRRSVEGWSWKSIANDSGAGLNIESVTCCLDLRPERTPR